MIRYQVKDLMPGKVEGFYVRFYVQWRTLVQSYILNGAFGASQALLL